MSSPAQNPISPQAGGLPAKLARLRAKLVGLFSRSIYGILLVVVVGGLVVPAVVGSYILIGVREQQAARTALDESLQRYADILALGMQESLWNMNYSGSKALVDAVMRDRAVLRIHVMNSGMEPFVDVSSPQRPVGKVTRAEREVRLYGSRIGWLWVEMDDANSAQELRGKQVSYALVLAAQITVSLLLIVWFINKRLINPLRRLMGFSDRLSHGDFTTELKVTSRDELGRLGRQLEQMRVAIRQLFDDIGQREERFRTIVTQVPGAVFRFQPHGPIEFISNAVEEISGYPASRFLDGGTDAWQRLVCGEDRDRVRDLVDEAVSGRHSYQVEYRILGADGAERWVSESGQPEQKGGNQAQLVDGILVDISERKRYEMRIEALLAEQGAILDNVMFGVMFVRQRKIVSANRRCEDLFGYPVGALNGCSTQTLFPDAASFEAAGAKQYPNLGGGEYFVEERQYLRRGGSLFWCRVSGCALDPARPNEGSIWVYADISESKEAEEKLRLSAKVLEHIADGVVVTDPSGRMVAVNPAFTLITGYQESEVLGKSPAMLRSGRHDAGFYRAMWADLAEGGMWDGEIWNLRKNGELYLESMTISAVRDGGGQCTHYVGVFRDITAIKESQEKLDHLAHHDPLTGLPNRLLFHDRLGHAILRSTRADQELALLFIDLDRFKNVNDTLGHHIGDELLQHVSRELAIRVRDGDTLARLGGDEFILLLESVDGHYGAGVVAEKLMSVFEQPFVVANHELFVTCSIGISVFPSDGEDLNMLIRNADVAMYQAKAHGRHAYRFYSPEMTGEGVERLRLESLLRRSIDKGEVFLNYQPQVDIRTGKMIGVEALVRWHHPELGLVSPVKFIPLAEDTGFINQLGKWVLFEACRQMVRWEQDGLQVGKLAVNLSVKQFERGSIVAIVADILRETGLDPARLQLEVTESLIMNTGDALVFINDLHKLGVGLAIDDFGTGYSSLAYLKQLPVQTLKIDRSFIKDIDSGQSDDAIAVAIIQLGKSLNLSVVAEGVETQAQVDFLLANGCHVVQGYFYSRPVMADELLERWKV